jgi:simple sugar transport system permease protein
VSVAPSDTGSAGTTPPAPGPAKAAAPSAGFNPLKRFLLMKEGSIVVVTAATLIYFAISTPHFFTSQGLQNLLPFFAPFAILAAGEVFVMINGEIDLSIGGTYLIAPFIFNEFTSAHIPLLIAMILAILVCTVVGVINGFFISYIGVNSFVTTLGTLFALYGITLVMSHDTQIQTPGTSLFGGGTFQSVFGGGTYSELFWAIGIVIVLQLGLSFTKWGIYTVAVGGNRLGAKEAGINEKANMIRNFALCAALGAFVGILEAVRSGSATPDPAQASELLFQVIAAAVIGGTLLVGGFGTVVGAMIGALFIGIIIDGLDIKGVNANYLDLYQGLAILLAMTINVYIARVRVGAGRG